MGAGKKSVNKIIYGAKTLIDLTADTVTAETLAKGKTAHDKSGKIVTGTMSPGGDIDALIDRSIADATSGVTKVGDYAFSECKKLLSANFPAAASVGSNAFSGCLSLRSVGFPKAATIGESAFYSCLKLTSIALPEATSIGAWAFDSCIDLTSASLPKATSIGKGAFSACFAIPSITLPKATAIGVGAFEQCNNLANIYLSGAQFCEATGNPAIGTECKIHVPSALLKQYKTATNWSKYSRQFVAI